MRRGAGFREASRCARRSSTSGASGRQSRGAWASRNWNTSVWSTPGNVPDGSGVTRWALATVPLPMMRKAGLTRELLAGRPGETVTIDALPGLNGTKQGWIVRITYSDGHFYQLSGR